MTPFAPSDIPALPRGVRLHRDAARERTVLLAPERAFELGETAAAVLALIDGVRCVEEIVRALAASYDAERKMIEADVLAMLDELAGKRVLERRAAPIRPGGP